MKLRRKNLFVLATIALTLATPSTFAATLYWDVNGTTAGFSTVVGAWNTGTFWNTDSTGGSGGTVTATTTGVDDLIIGPATTTNTGTITLTGTKILKSLTFGTTVGAVTLTGGTLSFAGGGGITVASTAGNQIISSGVTIAGNNTLNVGSGRTLTLNGTFTRSAGATLNVQSDAGGVIFSPAANVNRIVAPWANFGTGASTTYAAFGATTPFGMVGLTYAASPTATQGTSAAGAGNITDTTGAVNYTTSSTTGAATGAGARINTLRYTGSGLTISNTNLLVTKGIMNAGTGALTFSNAVTAGSGANVGTSATEMVVNTANNNITFNGAVTGTITKTGSGTMTLGNVTHSVGGITVNEGILIANGGGGYSGTTTINAGTLRGVVVGTSLTPTSPFGSSTIILNGGTLSIQASGTLNTTAQTVTFGNNVEVAGDAIIDVTRPGLTSQNKTMEMGTLSIGTNSLQVTHSQLYKLSFGATTLTGNATFNPSTSTTTTLTLGAVGASGGPRNLTKSGVGNLILNGAGSYTGSTTLSAGTLILGHVSALGGNSPGVNGTSAISMATGTTLRSTVSGVTISAPITTTGSVTFGAPTDGTLTTVFNELILNGAIGGASTTNVNFNSFQALNTLQTFTLGAASNYSGTTTLGDSSASTASQVFVKLGINDALPTTTVLKFEGGAGSGTGRGIGLNLFGYSQRLAGLTNTEAASRVQQVVNSDASAPATLTIDGSTDTTYTGFLGTTVSGTNLFSVNAAIPGSTNGDNFGLTKDGSGTFTLSPKSFTSTSGPNTTTWSDNTYSGPTKILGGILSLGVSTAMSRSPLDTLNSVTGNGTRGLRTTVTTLTMGGLTGNKNLVDVFTDATGGPANATANGGYDGLTALTLNPVSGATHIYFGDIGNGAGSMSLTKTGAGTQILSGTNTYTGPTNVQGGKLAINGSVTTNIDVQSGATLGGNGAITGNVSILAGGTFAAGNSIDSLAITGNYSMTNANFSYELDANAAAGAEGDLTTVTGALNLNGTNTLTLTEGSPFGNWTLGSPLGDHLVGGAEKLTLIAYNGTWNGGLFTYLGNLVQDDSAILLNGRQWWFNYNDNDAGINFTTDSAGFSNYVTLTVPEPRAALLGGLGLLALLRRRNGALDGMNP